MADSEKEDLGQKVDDAVTRLGQGLGFGNAKIPAGLQHESSDPTRTGLGFKIPDYLKAGADVVVSREGHEDAKAVVVSVGEKVAMVRIEGQIADRLVSWEQVRPVSGVAQGPIGG